jgi:hypothetical protein
MALRLSGWKLRIDRRLQLQHFMPAQRLKWAYLRHLQRGYSASWAILDAYTMYNLSSQGGLKFWLGQRWWCQLVRSLVQLASRPRAVVAALFSKGEGRYDVIEVEKLFGRALGLLRSQGRYGELRREVREARWRRLEC